MSYEPLHHKYRPQTFAELVGQEAIASTLTNAIRQEKIAPAYLFTGARGTGKTSSARILAKSLNCLSSKTPTEKPCGICEVCRAIAKGDALDVIEIDAASNTGVDNIRELIERSQFAPVQCRYKVYIIDEVHMLSTAAFNALLKTLEEPPDRVVFILATTDPQRVLPTIISRCQRFDYRRIPLEPMADHLRHIADKESILITAEAVTLVAQIAQGGLRDAESLLDQLSLLPTEINVEQVWDLVGSVPERDLLELVGAIAQDDPEAVLDSTRRLMDRGREPLIVLQNLASFYRDMLIAKTAPQRNDLVALTLATWQQLCDLTQALDIGLILTSQQHLRNAEIQLKNTTQPRLWLEVTLMGLLPSAVNTSAIALPNLSPAQLRPASTLHKPATLRQSGTSAPAASSVVPAIPQNIPAPSNQPAEPRPAEPAEALEPADAIRETLAKLSTGLPTGTAPQTEPVLPTPPLSTPPLPTLPSDLETTWQQVILQIQPFSSQVMVRQRCHLVAFDGEQARLAVSTPPLLKLAQEKLPNIELAFEQVFGQKIRITLEVAAPGQQVIVEPQAQAPPPVPPAHPQPKPRIDSSPPPQSQSFDPPQVPPQSLPKTESPNQSLEEVLGKETAPKNINKDIDGSPSWKQDEVTDAAHRLADFFAGKVVDDEDAADVPINPDLEVPEPEIEPEEPRLTETQNLDSDLDDDDDDIPF
ncbi:DNA polymerase III subunit gamma/tau [Leptolyngbyaceae cyanobacterium UHCC 1019]